jgi:hypothetical protein
MLALLLLTSFVLGGGIEALAKSEAELEQPPAGRAGDVRDTHERLERIYKRLGIERTQEKPVKLDEGEGCNRGRRSGDPAPRARTPGLTPAMPPFLGYLLIGIVVIAMLVPLYYALRSSYRDAPKAVAAAEEEEAASPAAAQAGPWRVDLSECRRLLEAGRLAEAFAALHRVTLIALEKNHHLTLDEATTNWEYVRRLASKPALKQTLAGVTLAAEESVLGKRPPDRSRYLGLERQVLEATSGGEA